MKRLSAILCVLAFCGSASARGALTTSVSPPTPAPVIIQHLSSEANPVGVGIAGNTFKITIGGVGAGNGLAFETVYPHGATVTISDTLNGSWPAAAKVVDNGVGNYVQAFYFLPNSAAGTDVITVGLGSSTLPFRYNLEEVYNVATSSAVNGVQGAAGVSGPNLSTGSFTPGNNDANGGNLILAYCDLASAAGGNPSLFTPGGSFSLLDGDIAWINNQGFPHASMSFLQTTSAAINPAMTAAAGTGSTNSYNCITAALKAANAGTPKPVGIHVDKIITVLNTGSSSTTWKLQIPAQGNTRVLTVSGFADISDALDSEGHHWTVLRRASDSPQICYLEAANGAVPNLALTITLTTATPTSPVIATFFDVSGGSSNSFDKSVTATASGSGSSYANQPNITPANANGLVIGIMSTLSNDPTVAVTAPVGAIYDYPTFTGQTGLDTMANGDGRAHFYNSTTAAENWTWTVTAASGSVDTIAAAFH